MKYFRNELGHLRQVEDDVFKRIQILQPEIKEVILEEQEVKEEIKTTNEINKLETLKKDETNSIDSGANAKPKTTKGASKKGNSGVLGEAKAKQSGGKKVQTRKPAKTTTTRRTTSKN